MNENIEKAAEIIRGSRKIVAFTGAGISVESGIPPFRGEAEYGTDTTPICSNWTIIIVIPKNRGRQSRRFSSTSSATTR